MPVSSVLAALPERRTMRRPRLTLRRLIDALLEADARHRQRVHLVGFDDRMLRDVGLTPADIRREILALERRFLLGR
jgi:uncharacterized protein YjiS (DUF1127 family)